MLSYLVVFTRGGHWGRGGPLRVCFARRGKGGFLLGCHNSISGSPSASPSLARGRIVSFSLCGGQVKRCPHICVLLGGPFLGVRKVSLGSLHSVPLLSQRGVVFSLFLPGTPRCVCVCVCVCVRHSSLNSPYLSRGVALFLQLSEDLQTVSVKELCGKLCGPTLVFGSSQVFTQVRGALVCGH